MDPFGRILFLTKSKLFEPERTERGQRERGKRNKNFENLNENYNFLLPSILIAGRGPGLFPIPCKFSGFGGGGDVDPVLPPGDATDYK